MKLKRVVQSDGSVTLEVVKPERKIDESEEKKEITEKNKEMIKENTQVKEQRVTSHKWSDELINKIKEEHLNGMSCTKIHKIYGVPRSTVWKIVNEKEWKVKVVKN